MYTIFYLKIKKKNYKDIKKSYLKNWKKNCKNKKNIIIYIKGCTRPGCETFIKND